LMQGLMPKVGMLIPELGIARLCFRLAAG
jgi:hypothetical protein